MNRILAIAAFTAAGVFAWHKIDKAMTVKPIENIDTPREETPLAQESREEDSGGTDVIMRPIHFGDLSIDCPVCYEETDVLLVGLGTLEDTESGQGDINGLYSIGVLCYPCGHIIHSMCLADKVAVILNAEEVGKIKPDLFHDLTKCSEHSGDGSSD